MAKYKNTTKLPIRFTLQTTVPPTEICMGEGDIVELPEGEIYVETLVSKKMIEKQIAVVDAPASKITTPNPTA